ncbi:hypothetical protein ABK040_001131 [Willaertia magna]
MSFVLSDRQVEEFTQAFKLIDCENKGYISIDDLSIVLRSLRIYVDKDDLSHIVLNEIKSIDANTIDEIQKENDDINGITALDKNLNTLGFLDKRKLMKAQKHIEYRYGFDLPEFITFIAYAISKIETNTETITNYTKPPTTILGEGIGKEDMDEEMITHEREELERALEGNDYNEQDNGDNKREVLFKNLYKLFEIFEDKNCMGFITKQSLQLAMDNVGEYLPEKIFNEMFEEVDFAKTGKISLEQFLSLFDEE